MSFSFKPVYAQFVTPTENPVAGEQTVKTDDYLVRYVYLDPDRRYYIKQEIMRWEILLNHKHDYENDVYHYTKHDASKNAVQMDQLISYQSSVRGTNDITGDYLIIDGEFAGVVVRTQEEYSNSRGYSQKEKFCILYCDGRISGSNVHTKGYTTEDSSRWTTNVYTLHRKG